jgi:hypothetical protein
MGILFGFAPWLVYWVLVGNVPPLVAVVVALAIALVGLVASRSRRLPARPLEIGALATFLLLTAATVVLSPAAAERWELPLSIAGIFLVVVAGVLAGKPFVREFVAAGQPQGVVDSEVFGQVTTRLAWIWVAVLGAMTVSSVIPPIVLRNATILDAKTPLSYVCYWVVPFSLLGLAALATKILPDVMTTGAGDIVRKTTFVAYDEATIDELYYLAQEHANREVGAGQEAYNVKVGGIGTPLLGDEGRQSWPSTYKVRQAR